MKKIMVATDGSESAADAVDAAIELAQQMERSFTCSPCVRRSYTGEQARARR